MMTAKNAKEKAKIARERYIKNAIVETIDEGYDSIIFENEKFFDDIERLRPELENLGYKVIRKNKTVLQTKYEIIEVSWG